MKQRWIDRWLGRAVVCIASGPSLTPEDCETVRAAGLPTIVTNTTFRLAPWADVLMGFDCKWWRHYRREVDAVFKGERIGCSPAVISLGVPTLHKQDEWFKHYGNSGTAAVSLAIAAGAARVVLLGYDVQKTGGRVHWHGDHPPALGNARSIGNWPTQFKNLARFAEARGVPVLNASRETALKSFPRVSLAEALACEEVAA